ncbi:MAG: CoB--CoM heterodisulfide reductase iron-sulfur subunit A family protein [Paludibacteraceae bacterium]|nr:CoB--CoM heterodisulfide reductase iron-sulfur subunit A family protein [Paludibacteraceae bacterium]
MKEIVVVGAGIAGMEASWRLASLGYKVTLIEKKETIGGHVANWDRLFPNRRPASEVIDHLIEKIKNDNITLMLETNIVNIERTRDERFFIQFSNNRNITSDAILFTIGFNLFNARRKEEYGYGIYDNVITSAELEKMLREKGDIVNASGETPKKVGIVHCVGSRDEKCGNMYCSKVCCVTGVKQAIEIKELHPDTQVLNFYMDLRMFSRNFEQLYLEAQKNGVRFVRGRLSESSETKEGAVNIKVEDTLNSKPLKVTVDMLVLMVGYEPATDTATLANNIGIDLNRDRFLGIKDEHIAENLTNQKGVFVAGACTGPKSINETMADARSAVFEIHEFFKD